MSKIRYIAVPERLRECAELADATAEELRVLLALITLDADPQDTEALAKTARTSVARAKAATTLWREAGVITEYDPSASAIEEEHGEVLRRGELTELSAEDTTRIIRRDSLAPVLYECARLMGRAALNQSEVKMLTALMTEYALTDEYVLTLAAHLAQKKRFTAAKLRDEAIKLNQRGYDTIDKLEKHIAEQEYLEGVEWEYRRLLGISGRLPSERECEYIKRWSGEFDFSVEVVKVAYDVCVINAHKVSLPYMDKLLTTWHEAGCRTAAECRSKYESDRVAYHAEKSEKSGTPKRVKSKTAESTPRYGNFDVNEAFAAALSRSFGDDD